jgi:hypothetical protein
MEGDGFDGLAQVVGPGSSGDGDGVSRPGLPLVRFSNGRVGPGCVAMRRRLLA